MLKKFILVLTGMLFLLGSLTQAQFVDEKADVIKVVQAKKLADKSWVVLEGYISKRLGADEYSFTDDSGSIKIIVRNSSWQGIEVSSKTKVRISGQVDKLFVFLSKRTIKVDKVELSPK